jgi:outer membrane protein OmpA-like peptidoglycan-associated protein
VLCDFTAMLVLETDADYARFRIDRRAMADILTIGTDGIEVSNRRDQPQPVVVPPVVEKPPMPEGYWRDETGHMGKKDKAQKTEEKKEAGKGKRGGDAVDDLLDGAAPVTKAPVHRPPPAPKPTPTPSTGATATPPPASPVAEPPTIDRSDIGSRGDLQRARQEHERASREQAEAERRRSVEQVRPADAPPPPPPAPPREHRPASANDPMAGHDEGGQPDRDGDGIPDSVDRCPDEPENYNGFEDQDGCPDRARVIVQSSRIEVLDRIYFETGKTIIKPVSFPILDAIAATLRANPQIALVEIQGHSDERGDDRANLLLTDGRAAQVRTYLIDHGVESRRLQSRGYGESRPLCPGHNEECWSRNRRVEFVILRTTDGQNAVAQPRPVERQPPPPPAEPSPYEGKLRDVMQLVDEHKPEQALKAALAWRDREPGDVMALIALGEAGEAAGKKRLAARAYGSIIDLFPARADMRRFAGERLERLGDGGLELAIDTFKQARASRADHPASHRLLAYALLRAGKPAEAFDVIVEGARTAYPQGRFAGVDRILHEDVGLIAAAWLRREPNKRKQILDRVAQVGAEIPTTRSLRFVLNWETDANDVDFHIFDARGGHAYYSQKVLPSGGELYADVTTGYGPECFTIAGAPAAYPYRLQAHYYSRGPMGYGMGKLEIIEHDGQGNLVFDERPFVIMIDRAFVKLGDITKPLIH